ncbi:glycosyltransferase family 25 protein [Isosphaeraceae bacterium EP7]
MDIIDYFDHTYIVSLLSRTDRRRDVTLELKKHGMPLQPGKVEFFDACRPDSPAGFENIGYRGCFMSHLEILRKARDGGFSRVLILEDDVKLTPQFDEYRDEVVRQLTSTDWDIVYLGHPASLPAGPGLQFVRHDKPLLLTHCYAVNGKALDRLVVFLEALLTRPPGDPEGGPMSYDGALSTFRRRNPDVVTLLANPNLATQRPSRTDIHDNRWFDRVPGVQQMATLARRLLDARKS